MSDLDRDAKRGRDAQNSWDTFVGPFIDTKRKELFEAFQQVSITNVDDLVEIRRTLATLNALETELSTIIDTGRLASIALAKDN